MPGDPVQPCAEGTRLIEHSDASHDGEPHILPDVLGVAGPSEQPAEIEQEGGVVAMDERRPCLGAAELGAQHLDVLDVGLGVRTNVLPREG